MFFDNLERKTEYKNYYNHIHKKIIIDRDDVLSEKMSLFLKGNEDCKVFFMKSGNLHNYKFHPNKYLKSDKVVFLMLHVESGNLIFKDSSVGQRFLEKGDTLFVMTKRDFTLTFKNRCANFFIGLFKPSFFGDYLFKRLSPNGPFALLINSPHGDKTLYIQFASINNIAIIQNLSMIIQTIYKKDYTLQKHSMLYFMEFLHHSSCNNVVQSNIKTYCTGKIMSILSKIKSDYNFITLDELARDFGYNPSYLSQMIKHSTNKTFSEHVKLERLRKAKYLLEMTDMSINEISLEIGYVEVSYFNKLFKKDYMCTPSEYRKYIRTL